MNICASELSFEKNNFAEAFLDWTLKFQSHFASHICRMIEFGKQNFLRPSSVKPSQFDLRGDLYNFTLRIWYSQQAHIFTFDTYEYIYLHITYS